MRASTSVSRKAPAIYGVAQGVVNEFEAVYIEVKNRESGPRPVDRVYCAFQPLHEAPSIGQSRKRIVKGLVGHFTLRALALSYVAADAAGEVVPIEIEMIPGCLDRDS
jgi:hypothetical protein